MLVGFWYPSGYEEKYTKLTLKVGIGMALIIVYLFIINLAGLAMMGVDKGLAKQRKRRIPEKRLFLTALAGGALGVWIGMRVWRHKTMHNSFTLGIPLLFVVNIGILIFIFIYF